MTIANSRRRRQPEQPKRKLAKVERYNSNTIEVYEHLDCDREGCYKARIVTFMKNGVGQACFTDLDKFTYTIEASLILAKADIDADEYDLAHAPAWQER